MANRMVRRNYPSGVNDMLSLRDMMGRLMENAFISPDQWFGDYYSGMRLPAVDVSEDQNEYVVRAELPGWRPEDIEITSQGDTITIKGQLQEGNQPEGDNTRYHHREMRRTSFERSITLPNEVRADQARADFENGILTLHLPKSEEAKPRQIKIGTGHQGQRSLGQGNTGQQGSQEMGNMGSTGGSTRSGTTRGTPSRQ